MRGKEKMVKMVLCIELRHPERYPGVLTPSSSEYDLIFELDLYRGNQVQMRSLGRS